MLAMQFSDLGNNFSDIFRITQKVFVTKFFCKWISRNLLKKFPCTFEKPFQIVMVVTMGFMNYTFDKIEIFDLSD